MRNYSHYQNNKTDKSSWVGLSTSYITWQVKKIQTILKSVNENNKYDITVLVATIADISNNIFHISDIEKYDQ